MLNHSVNAIEGPVSQAQGRIQSFPPTCTGRCFERNSKSLRQNENSPQKGVLGPPDSPVGWLLCQKVMKIPVSKGRVTKKDNLKKSHAISLLKCLINA